jgi:mevalonate kinase
MLITASAPGKVILFGEHAVVYGKPAIAVAVNKKAHLTIKERQDSKLKAHIKGLDINASLDLENIPTINHEFQRGILKYVLKSWEIIQEKQKTVPVKGLDILLNIEMPIGAGLGSSAAVTVATLSALNKYYKADLERDEIANLAYQVELKVQGAASPIDTTLSTYGGAIYLSTNRKAEKLPVKYELPLIIGHTPREGNTEELIRIVRKRMEKYPNSIKPIFESIEQVTMEAREALLEGDHKKLGELMNINHGLLDALGVSTPTLSRMIYQAREAGALGSKITGAGGGGSIIAYSPGKTDEVLQELGKLEKAFQIKLSEEGVTTNIQ